MSLLGSVSTAVTGLTAQSNAFGNISDNLANTSTTGYKTIGTSFEAIVSTASGPETGGNGAIAAPAYYNNIQGTISTNSLDTSLAISGRGYFAVATENADASAPDTGDIYYTRSGDFTLNKDAYLTNGAGYYLMGWNVSPTTGAAATGALVPLQFTDMVEEGVATTAMTYEANLPASIAIGETTTDTTTTIYDSEGQAHSMTYAWEKTAVNTWELTATATGGAYDGTTENNYTAHATFVFNGTGALQSVTSADCVVTGTSLTFPLTYRYEDPDTHAVSTLTQTALAGFTDMTQFADTVIDVSVFAQNGAAKGSFSGISIDEHGIVAANYDNGVIRTLYQIPLAIFNAPEELQRMSGTAFKTTNTSGAATYCAANTDGAGKLTVAALECSTVDIADQFTRMIQAQRAYSANARTVSVANEMMKTLIDI